jgi:HK97 family phage major capsid protein
VPMTTEELIAQLNANHTAVMARMDSDGRANSEANSTTAARLTALEQAFAANRNGGGGNGGGRRGWGVQVAEHARFKAFLDAGKSGSARIPIRAELTTPSGTEQRDLVAPQRDQIQGLPQQLLTVRSLLTVIPTTSNKIDYVKQTSRTVNAAGVADGAEKPESDLGFELAEAPVRTIAHWVPCPRQTMDDLPELGALIDGELIFGLRLIEEQQILAGDGSGQNLLGIIPQARAFDPPFAIAHENALDRILLAIIQAQQARLPVDGVLVNDVTWGELISTKDDEGRYVAGASGGPFGSIPGLLWQVRVVPTPSMAQGEALVGAFRLGARLHDRLEPEVLISSEDRDNFIKNMLTIRAEERVALSVRVPDAFVYVDELGSGTTG